ncbi:unnamed protein product [Mycetohabitans rhizoxinica HKI 454]|uniref:Uncharacterized protein n=1 Tax=Mycetohabitans rhizoxinica (strain DSM 19002 / CIP 109453 / HKI 454) TaxID=882378 RepID=E5AKT1_MYCRK|nr:unnamed protein product [Mycetohabitans rhizoxinica HKI 454]
MQSHAWHGPAQRRCHPAAVETRAAQRTGGQPAVLRVWNFQLHDAILQLVQAAADLLEQRRRVVSMGSQHRHQH